MKDIGLDMEKLAKAASRSIDEIQAVEVTEAMTYAAERYWESFGQLRNDAWSCLSRADFDEIYRVMFVLRPRKLEVDQAPLALPSP